MTNIHYLHSFKPVPIKDDKINVDFIDTLYDFCPRGVFYWTLKFARIKFNQRIKDNTQTWFDRLQVYVGLPDWVVIESQLESENIAHLKVPFGLLTDIEEISNTELNVSVPFQVTHSDTGEAYNSLHHTSVSNFYVASLENEKDIRDKTGVFEDMEDQHESLIEYELDNVWKKKQFVVERLRSENFQSERIEVLYICISTCMGLADGKKDLIEEFVDIEDAGEIGPEEARKIYSNFTIEEFFEWGTDHFGLDDYYLDAQTVVDNIKCHIEDDEDILETSERYRFITKIIARSERHAEAS